MERRDIKLIPLRLDASINGMSGIKEQVLSLPIAEKREIFHALQMDLADDPIPELIIHVLEERRREYRVGEVSAEPAKEVFDRLLKKYPSEDDRR